MIIVKIGQGRGKVGGKAGKAIRNLPWDFAKKKIEQEFPSIFEFPVLFF